MTTMASTGRITDGTAQAPDHHSRQLALRLGLLAGAPAGVLAVGSVAMWGPERQLDESQTALQVSAGLGFLLITLLFAFGAALRTRLQGRLPAGSALPALAAAGVWGAATLLCWAYSLRSAFGIDGGSGPLGDSFALRQVTDSLPLASWIPVGATAVAIAVAGLRYRAVPRALGAVCAVLAVIDIGLLWAGIFPVGFPVGALTCLVVGATLGLGSLREPR
jgi:hypothetical protein